MIIFVIGGAGGLAEMIKTRQEVRDANITVKVVWLKTCRHLASLSLILLSLQPGAVGRERNTTLEEEHEVF